MAKEKKSFIAYCNWKSTFDALPDEDAGKLIKHLLAYVNDEEPETDSVLINAVFANIKDTLKRDLSKYDVIKEKRSLAGKASAEKRKQDATNSTSVESDKQTPTNPTVSDNVSGNVNDIKTNTTAKSYDYAREKSVLNNVSNLFDSKFYDTEKKKANWLNTIRLLHHTDNFSYEKIEAAIRFARADDFWKNTFISIPTLRKKKDDIMKIDKIIAKMPKAEHRAGKIKLYEPR